MIEKQIVQRKNVLQQRWFRHSHCGVATNGHQADVERSFLFLAVFIAFGFPSAACTKPRG
jgi:hypothetical protein